jgi:hypothetical protein
MIWGTKDKHVTYGTTGIDNWAYQDKSNHMNTWNTLPFMQNIPGSDHYWKGPDGADEGWCSEPKMYWYANQYRHSIVLGFRSDCGCSEMNRATYIDTNLCWWWRVIPPASYPVCNRNEAYLSFTNNSRDPDIGDTTLPLGIWTGDSCGVINGFMSFDKASLVEQSDTFKVLVFADKGVSYWPDVSCTVDISPRRTQVFKPQAWEVCRWYNIDENGSSISDSGYAQANQAGVVTVPGFHLPDTAHPVSIQSPDPSAPVKRLLKIVSTDSIGPAKAEDMGSVFDDYTFSIACQPNPFNPSTAIVLRIPKTWLEQEPVSISIYDIRGRLVRSVVSTASRNNNRIVAVWNGENGSKKLVPSGVYVLQGKYGTKIVTKRAVLLK